jgi:integrase
LGYLVINPTDNIERPKDDTVERSIYTPQQVRIFLDATQSDRLAALWYLAISTGLRRAELAGLHWFDVDLSAQTPLLNVRISRTTAGNRIVESGPKTKSGKRTLVLDQGSVDILEDHRVRMEKESALRGEESLPGYVFVDEFGAPFHPSRLTRMLHAIQRRVGLPEITLHDLRHTSATVALLAGVHPKVVSERHGHASVQITLDRYSHVLESMQISAAESIGRFLEPKE